MALIKYEDLCRNKYKKMGLLDFLFGDKSNTVTEFKDKGAIIIDVRTPGEYKQGAIPGSKNIPLQTLNTKIDYIKKLNKPVITCCASGMRSANAASILNRNNIEATNGGGWQSLQNKL